MKTYLWVSVAVGMVMALGGAFARADTSLDAELRALDALRKGLDTPLDEVDQRGESLLKKYERPEDQAQIHYQLAHVHAQSGMQHPDQIIKHAKAALDSELITPRQRGTLYSYLCSAHEVDKSEKDFSVRRRKAVQPLLTGLKELQGFNLPDAAPELPALGVIGLYDGPDPAEAARFRALNEAARLRREKVQLTRDLVQRRDTLRMQVKYLYYRGPNADDELRELAGAALGADAAKSLVEAAQAERERIEKARRQRKRSSDP